MILNFKLLLTLTFALCVSIFARGEWTLLDESEGEPESARVRAAEDFSVQFKIAAARFESLKTLMSNPDFYVVGDEERSHGRRPVLVNSVEDFFPALEKLMKQSPLQRSVNETFLYDLNFIQVPGYVGDPFKPSRESPLDEPRNRLFFHLYNRMRFENARFNQIRAAEGLPSIRNVLVVSGDSYERVTEILLFYKHLELLQMSYGPGEYPPIIVGVVEGVKIGPEIEYLREVLTSEVFKVGKAARGPINTYIQHCAVASDMLAIDERAAGVNSKRSFAENLILATSTPELREKRARSLHRIQIQIPDEIPNVFNQVEPWLKGIEDLAKMAMRAEGIPGEVHSLPRLNFDLQSGHPNSSSTQLLKRLLKRGLIDSATGRSNFNVAIRFWAGKGETSGMSWKETVDYLERGKTRVALGAKIQLNACLANLNPEGGRTKRIRSSGSGAKPKNK